MNTALPPTGQMPPHRHARIRATLVRTASEPQPARWMAPALTVATAITILGLIMWLVPLGDGDGRAAGPVTTSTITTSPAGEPSVRQVQIPAGEVPALVDRCVESAKVKGTFELKLAFADAAGQLAVLYSADKMIACRLGGPPGSTFAVVDPFRPPVVADLNQTAPVGGSQQDMAYQLVIGRVDPAKTARVTLTQNDVVVDAVLVGDVYAGRIIRPADWWLKGNPPQPVVRAYNAEGGLVGSTSPHP
jgi:hypothetical protein